MYCISFLRYRLEVYVQDKTASTAIFNQLVEKIIQVPVIDLYMQKEMVIYLCQFTHQIEILK